MAYIELPVRSDIPAYDFQAELEGTLFGFNLQWNERGQFWSLDLADANGVTLLNGLKLVTGYPLLIQYRNRNLPRGEILCVDTSGENKSPGIDDFGTRILMVYRESTTDDEAISG